MWSFAICWIKWRNYAISPWIKHFLFLTTFGDFPHGLETVSAGFRRLFYKVHGCVAFPPSVQTSLSCRDQTHRYGDPAHRFRDPTHRFGDFRWRSHKLIKASIWFRSNSTNRRNTQTQLFYGSIPFSFNFYVIFLLFPKLKLKSWWFDQVSFDDDLRNYLSLSHSFMFFRFNSSI